MGRRANAPTLLTRVLRGAEGERSAQATLAAWQQYRHACELRLRLDPPAPGPVCNRSFDMYVCWGDAPPNSTATVPCPWYLPWHHRVQGGVVARRCGPDGQWVTDGTGRPWRDHSQCEDLEQEQPLQHAWLLEQFRLVYTVGYSLSLISLLLALLLLLLFRRLRCTRNYIHANLFLSFVLRAGAILTRDALLHRHLRPGLGDPLQLLSQQAVAGCRLAQALTQYCVGANYGWLLAEGLFLHKLLVLATFSGDRCLPAFLLLGWGAPVLFVVPWVVVRYLYENEGCWERNEKAAVWWIIRCPILMAVAVNFVVFVRIVRILVAKVRAHQVARGDCRVRLAKSTLTLIPLLGVHEVAFALVAEEQAGGTVRLVRLFLQLLLSSSQGLIVSVLYCFVNKEVQAESQPLGRELQLPSAPSQRRMRRARRPCACARHPGSGAERRSGRARHLPGLGAGAGSSATQRPCHAALMEPNAFPQLQLWCPRPFGTYTQNKPCPVPGPTKKPCRAPEEPVGPRAPSENTPPPPAAPPDEGRVLLDTWYVIKPGNTKEKVAFFVAHQCGGTGRASTMKVKGNWGSESSKAKRRRRCHHPGKSKNGADGEGGGEPPDLLSVAEMVALVEQRTALALQGFQPPAAPVVFMEAAGEAKTPAASADCSRVAEAVAHFESRQRGGARHNGLCHPGAECAAATAATTATAAVAPAPGEVRIAFRISSGRENRPGSTPAEPAASGGRPNCVFVGCGAAGGTRAKDKITCDLYQLISPSRDALPNNVEFLLASAAPKGDGDGPDVDMGCGEGTAPPGKPDATEGAGGEASAASASRDCVSGFHVDVVVTGVVDQCVFFGKDSAKKMKEETVRLPAPQDDPPPGQLFLLPGAEEAAEVGPGAAEAAEETAATAATPPDPSLCRLYRHVSHDFLEIRFKIQRLLEPRQYMLLLPEHVMVKIFSYLPTQALAALKCSCHYFKSIIETFGVQATDSRWNRDPLYRDDPCKQCKKHYEKGDVSLCRWHPKPYHHDLPYGRSYWMCCRRPDKEAPGCRVGLHDNNWVHPAARRDDGR